MIASAGGPIRILIADDHPMLREGVAAIIRREDDMVLVGEAADGLEAVARFRDLQPDITLLDLQMPNMDGIEAIGLIRQEFPDARIVVLTTYAGDTQALRALRAGAMGYLLKSSLRRELLDTVRMVHRGGRAISPEVAQQIALHATQDILTEREIAILRRMAAGDANKEIGRWLSVSEDTVKTNVKSLFAKLDVSDRTRAVTVAIRRGIIDV